MVFGLPFTEELRGRAARLPEGTEVCFGDELAVKCDDDLFLADVGGRIILAEELPDESLRALDAGQAAAGAAAGLGLYAILHLVNKSIADKERKAEEERARRREARRKARIERWRLEGGFVQAPVTGNVVRLVNALRDAA